MDLENKHKEILSVMNILIPFTNLNNDGNGILFSAARIGRIEELEIVGGSESTDSTILT